ncbi:hypothetical protein [Pelotomaculum propionicicum]|uniref:Uncharacterized protein n=1 Tax=Pelotomaculum propionicicum TaxID=258475 RepID=A0A4Y7RUY9_9FIRM|nr:hypothetical protein [Pelotomaculum propionicicum]NLI12601.1 hypothetical protein [Peptococcaceae bacterium]TEB12818.1 hypothetical protein Pmgp_00794 [Pelotomaculum propionicicum]
MYELIRKKASQFMLKRGWKELVAKSGAYQQSLFEHTMCELDVLLQLLPILRLPNHYDLKLEEEQILIVSVIGHDIGKETKEFQDYIKGLSQEKALHIITGLTKKVVPEICEILGFSDLQHYSHQIIENCINLHMSRNRTDANLIFSIFQGIGRWKALADIVYTLDNFCSARGMLAALSTLEQSNLSMHIKLAYHQVVVRGVSTVFLHKAAVDSFIKQGWSPILFFSEGTIYAASSASQIYEPARETIEGRLFQLIEEVTGKDVSRLMVGSPVANILPKPDLFDYKETEIYLRIAAGKIKRSSFARKKYGDRVKVVKSYLKLIKPDVKELSQETVDRLSERIDIAQPEMVIFKFFKAIMGENLIGREGVSIAAAEYERMFGEGSWRKLQSTSTLMPARDMAHTVDYFWKLPADRFGYSGGNVGELADEKRDSLLISILNGIAERVYSKIETPPSRSTVNKKMAAAFIEDLIRPSKQEDLKLLVEKQLKAYSQSKPFAGKETKKAEYICPVCNLPFDDGVKASADFLSNPQTHTNRGVSHGKFDYVMICRTCYFERILRQLLLQEKSSEMIVLLPRMNIGYQAGQLLVERVQKFYEQACIFMFGSGDPDRQMSLSLTHLIARNVSGRELYQLSGEEIAGLLTYRHSDETRKKLRRDLEKRIKHFYEGSLEQANLEWATEFPTWDEAISAVINNLVDEPVVTEIRDEVYRLGPQLKTVCQTPNLILIPLTQPIILGKDGDANAALRRLFVSLFIGLALDATVAIISNNDGFDFEGWEGVALVPPVASIRKMVNGNWISLENARRWFRAIGAASILTPSTAYPERSNLFAILSEPTPGHILRRIEEKNNGQVSNYHFEYLDIIEEVLH